MSQFYYDMKMETANIFILNFFIKYILVMEKKFLRKKVEQVN